MSANPTPKNSIANTLKIYVFPSLVTILAMLIWRDVSELRSDVKSLLAQSNIDKTEILNLKKDVDMLNRQVFKTPMVSIYQPVAEADEVELLAYHDKYFKPEEEYDIKKYLIID